jgi:DNA-binding beta-propeller fold protein YncE
MRALLVSFAAVLVLVASASARQASGTTVALVTAEQQNVLLAVELPSGKVLRRTRLPADPQNVAIGRDTAVVVSPKSHAVTLLNWETLRVLKVIRSFAAPHIVAIGPGGSLAYVTDDTRGMLNTIDLRSMRVIDRLVVGIGAHHLAISPGGGRAWIALGEHAREIAIVSLANPRKPTPVRRFSPGFVVHDVTFTPDTRRVWLTSGTSDLVYALDSRTGKKIFAVRVGAAPQHVVISDLLNGKYAYATSGYDGRIVKVNTWTGHVVASAAIPRGSFNVSTKGPRVVTSSLLGGQVTELDLDLRRIRSTRVARAARGVALTVW